MNAEHEVVLVLDKRPGVKRRIEYMIVGDP